MAMITILREGHDTCRKLIIFLFLPNICVIFIGVILFYDTSIFDMHDRAKLLLILAVYQLDFKDMSQKKKERKSFAEDCTLQ